MFVDQASTKTVLSHVRNGKWCEYVFILPPTVLSQTGEAKDQT